MFEILSIFFKKKRRHLNPETAAFCHPEAKPKDLFSPHKVPVIRAPGPRRIRRALLLPLHLL